MSSNIILVAIIDDDEVFQMLIKKILEKKITSESILQFSNGFAALSHFRDHSNNAQQLPPIIFLDINMPGMDGWQFLEQFSQVGFNPLYKPSVFIISGAETFDIEVLRAYPVIKGYLVKPVAAADLINIIQNKLAGSEGKAE